MTRRKIKIARTNKQTNKQTRNQEDGRNKLYHHFSVNEYNILMHAGGDHERTINHTWPYGKNTTLTIFLS